MKKQILTKKEVMLVSDGVTSAVANLKATIHIQKDVPKIKGEPFTLLFQKLGIVTAKNIKPVTAKVLLYLCACVEYGNLVPRGSDQISNELGYSIRNIQRALSELEDLKIIIRNKNNETDGRFNMIYLNPYHSWKGKAAERKQKIAEYNPKQLEMFPEHKPKKALIEPNTNFLLPDKD
jgi:predicted transcriptional regulator